MSENEWTWITEHLLVDESGAEVLSADTRFSPPPLKHRTLIAAAPKLLDALKACQVRIFMDNGSENDEYRAASEAIFEAEG